MMLDAHSRSRLRAVCLRAVATENGTSRALVSLSAEQWLLVPLHEDDGVQWQSCIGRRFWVDLDAEPLQLFTDAARRGHDD